MLKFIYKIVGFFFARQQLYTFCLCLQGKDQVTLYMFTSFYFIMQQINYSTIFELKEYKLWIKLVRNIICMLKYTICMLVENDKYYKYILLQTLKKGGVVMYTL
jgi:hypothetical protein